MAELTDTQQRALRSAVIWVDGAAVGLDLMAVERVIREHVTAALDEIEKRIDQSGVRTDSAERWGVITALHIVRDYRQEQDQ